MNNSEKVNIKTHRQLGGQSVASANIDGRTVRVIGSDNASKETVIDLMENWITWIRRGSFS